MTKTEINKLKSLIAKASNDELEIVRVAFNDRKKALRTTVKTGLSVGDIVSLVHRKFGGKIVGEVMKIKRTKADVMLNGTVYNVPMGMLTKEVA
jgi:Cu/Ag efflux pump CusA